MLLLYFGLTFGLCWLLFIPAALLLCDRSGASPADVPGVAPLQTAGAAVPSLVAIALAGLLYGRQGLRQLFGGFRRWRVGVGWYLTAILLAPLLTVVALGLRVLLDGDFTVDPDSELGTARAEVGLAALLAAAGFHSAWQAASPRRRNRLAPRRSLTWPKTRCVLATFDARGILQQADWRANGAVGHHPHQCGG